MTSSIPTSIIDALAKLDSIDPFLDPDGAQNALLGFAIDLRTHRTCWRDIATAIVARPLPPTPSSSITAGLVRQSSPNPWQWSLDYCIENLRLCSSWERQFVNSIANARSLTADQRAKLAQIHDQIDERIRRARSKTSAN
jgi:hypothetical protein